jgi:serine/threonine-protein kinase HipA
MDVYYEHLRVGTIDTSGPDVAFRYDPSWVARSGAFPISLGMPLAVSTVGPERILPWLANLLPEAHLSEIGQRIGVSPQDILGLLARLGRDTAGALSIGVPRHGGDAFRTVGPERALARIIDELPQRPFLVGDEGVSMSLAGAQDKLPVAVVESEIAIPVEGTPSTHILKPDNPRLKGSVQNEALCMTLARLVGLDAAGVTTGRAGRRTYLLVERYDRIMGERRIVRVHQEDFCQLLGYFPSAKYEFTSPGVRPGPSLARLFEATATHVSPGARLALLDAVIFNVLVANVDAHAKNHSILIGAGGTARLAPLYDLLCGEVWPRITRRLPQAIAGRREAVHLHGFDWQALARAVGLSPARTLRRVGELCERVAALAPEARSLVAAMPAGDHPITGQIVRAIEKRCERIKRQLLILRPDELTSDPEADGAPAGGSADG